MVQSFRWGKKHKQIQIKQLLQDHTTSKWQRLNTNSGLLTNFYSQKTKEKYKSGDQDYINVRMATNSHKDLSPGPMHSTS